MMAESQEEQNQSDSGNWWGSWIQAAKEKSSQTLELIKHDLNEFGIVCSQDASAMVSTTSETLQHSLQGEGEASNTAYVKKGITNLLGGITRVLTIPPEDDYQDDMLRVTSTGNFEVFDKAKARLFEIQSSPQTYCTEPDGPVETFNEWKKTFDLDSRKGEISDLLVSVDEVRSIYTKLVPSAVTHTDFWQRYFYKVHQLEEDEKRKTDLKNRADKLSIDSSEQAWEDDWEADDSTEQTIASEPEQKTVDSAPKSVELMAAPQTDTKATNEAIFVEIPGAAAQEHNDSIPLDSSADITADVKPTSTDLADLPGNADTCARTDKSETDSSAGSSASTVAAEKVVDRSAQQEEVTAEVKVDVSDRHTKQEIVAVPAAQVTEVPSTGTPHVGETNDAPHKELKVKEKKDYVMVSDAAEQTPPSSVGSTNSKESSSGLDDDWDKELFGDDMNAVGDMLAEELAGEKDDINLDDVGDDWESWE